MASHTASFLTTLDGLEDYFTSCKCIFKDSLFEPLGLSGISGSVHLCCVEAVMLSQPVWDQMLESEKKKVQTLEESYAEKMRASNVSSTSVLTGLAERKIMCIVKHWIHLRHGC